jgi:diadenosine tetraphosphate (Ap4A) HIT family hydrolase
MNIDFEGRIFMEGAEGIAVASLGQIIEGYAVVFGPAHQINLRDIDKDERQNFLNFVQKVRQRVEHHFDSTVMFEHGACSPGTNVSCGVDRMHVHIVPMDGVSLIEELGKRYKRVAIFETVEEMLCNMCTWEKDHPYFWVENEGQVFLFAYGEKRESQVVRRAIAAQVGLSRQWNWREFPTQELAEKVAKRLSTGIINPQELQTASA